MPRYVSDNRLNLKVGVSSFSKDKTSLEVIGRVGINSALPQNQLDVGGSVNISNGLAVTGLTTLSGIVTTSGDLYVGGDLFVKEDVFKSELTAVNARITGVATIGTLEVTGVSSLGVTTATDLFANQISISGLSTFVGVVTTKSDLYVGGDLFIKDDLVFDEVTGANLNITGVATIGTLSVTGNGSFQNGVSVSGAVTATTFTGAGTGLTGITSATNATNIYGGNFGQLLYQVAPGATSSFENGSTNQVLASRGAGNPPQWVLAAPSGAIEGILLFDEGAQVGGGVTYAGIDFRGQNLIIAGGNDGGIATVTLQAEDFASVAGVATNVIGGIASVTSLNVNAGVSTFADFKITGLGVGATVGCSAGVATYFGRGTELTGIVTSLTAGENISINQSTGNVTITGLAKTDKIVAESLVVSGVSTLGIITGAESLGVGTVYANNIVGGSISGTDATFSGNVTIGGTLTYEDVTNIDAVGFITAREGINVGVATQAGVGVTFLANGSGVFAGIVTVVGEFNVGSATSQFTVQPTTTSVEVGIGTIDPNYNLDVRGTANVEGQLTVNGNTVPSLAVVVALGGF